MLRMRTQIFKVALIFLLLNFQFAEVMAQEWEMITGKLFAQGENPEFADDPFNRKLGALLCMPDGDLLLVRNGRHPMYRSTDQGQSWQPLEGTETIGRAYGSFSFSRDYSNSRVAVFMIVQKKERPALGLILSADGKVLAEIGKPSAQHDGWTWGMPAWEQDSPKVILGKEHHQWVVMWLSKDGGETWQKLDFTSRNPGVINEKTFVAGNEDGIHRSADQGQSWEKVSDFIVTGKNPIRYSSNFYWTTEKGVIWSQDQGKSWQLLGQELSGTLWGPYFGTSEQSMMVVNQHGFYTTTDHGHNWDKVADYFAPPNANFEGEYNVIHTTNSYDWDEVRGILYAGGLGADAYKLKLK